MYAWNMGKKIKDILPNDGRILVTMDRSWLGPPKRKNRREQLTQKITDVTNWVPMADSNHNFLLVVEIICTSMLPIND
jgi:hypothetical protein